MKMTGMRHKLMTHRANESVRVGARPPLSVLPCARLDTLELHSPNKGLDTFAALKRSNFSEVVKRHKLLQKGGVLLILVPQVPHMLT